MSKPAPQTPRHTIAEQSENYRYSTSHQVAIDAGTRLLVVVGRPVAGNRNDGKAWDESSAKEAVAHTTVIADSGYRGAGRVILHTPETSSPPGDESASRPASTPVVIRGTAPTHRDLLGW
ncbi:transposase [Streptomyces sp. FIT100]|nr:transposase [Streptomyces sp. FIT100]